MEIRENEKLCIFTPLCPILNLKEVTRLFKAITCETRDVAIDLSCVTDCTTDFIEAIKKCSMQKNIGIFNIPSDIFVLFNFMKLDKVAKLYVSEIDFEEKTRQLLNRTLTVVS